MTDIDMLASSCTMFISLLINLYSKGNITYEFFEENSKLKIKFLNEHIDKIEDQEKKAQAEQVLQQYNSVIEHKIA